MKALKLALIGSAALAAASVSARADDLTALKAQIEALNARVATLEATPAVPAGYSAVAFSRDANGAHVISVMPTADAPAAATITWTGYVRAAVVYDHLHWDVGGGNIDADNVDVRARAYLTVVGTTDTAVGEVGAKINIMGNGNGTGYYNTNQAVTTDGYSGWWKMTPNLTLEGGVGGNLSKSGHSVDALMTCAYGCDLNAGWVGASPYSGDPAHIKLAYADGPIGLAVQLEDGGNFTSNGSSGLPALYPNNNTPFKGGLGVTAKASYSSDMWSADLNGGYWGNPYDYQAGRQDAWAATAGLGAKLGMFSVDVSGGFTRGFAINTDNTLVSGVIQANLSDSINAQLGGTYVWQTQQTSADYGEIDAGLYWTPVKQLTLGVEGSYTAGQSNYRISEPGFVYTSETRGAFVTWWRF